MKKAAFFLLCFLAIKAFGQPSIGGTPKSFLIQSLSENIDTRIIPPPDLNLINLEDTEDGKNGVLRKSGRSVFTDINLNNSGTWDELPNGDRIWRVKIHCEGALALGVYFNKFWLPHGASLFIYNQDKTKVIGAFTENNNPENGLYATELIAGSTVVLEFFEPSRTRGVAILDISELAYVYRDYKEYKNNKDFGDSDNCQVNINCSEGTNWQDEKKGVARIFLKVGMQYGWCTGSLINNKNENCVPYFLTADHCGEGASTADLSQWVFHFNYEASACANPSNEPTSATITGCTLKSHGGNGGTNGSDFYLVQLSSTPTFNTYYNGWDRNNTPSSSGVSIHHPSGDIKKISTYTTALATDDWNGSGVQSHWRVVWAATANGHGVTEEGSSGSPIFNSAGLIVGDLTGGGSYCSATSQPDYYGKFSYSWDQNGTTAATRLKDWLDPNNTNVMTLSGKTCGGASSIVADFSGNPTAIPVGGSVNFTDLSTGGPTSWSWTFTGGTPANSSTQNPTNIQYNTAGIYPVSLTVSNGTGSDTETKNNYITVGDPPPIADFIANMTSIPVGGMVNFTDLSAGVPTSWNWTFTGGTPASSTAQNPNGVQYNTAGVYPVSLTVSNAAGSDNETKVNYITVGGSAGDKVCDTLHYPLTGNLIMYSIRYSNGVYGYVSGNNGYSDKAKADFFSPMSPYNKLIGVYFKFGKAKYAPSHLYKVPVQVWNNSGPGGSPGTILLTDSIPVQQIVTDVSLNHYTFLEFDTPLDLFSSFYLGVELPNQPGDTIVLLTNKNGQSMPGTAWEQWRDGVWHAYSDSVSWKYNLSHAIFPVICRADYGVNESVDISDILLYPNPAYNAITLKVPEMKTSKAVIDIFNLIGGKALKSLEINTPLQEIVVDISDLPVGIYFVRLTVDKQDFIQKLNVIR